ncbi:MAG: helix-turn-helix transcriptional regulator [Brachyspira sp.]|jgi:transcriptional regulator, XRE family protein|nr:helix-turn-helix transcriptional regulator [Brachyspira sp.]
MSQSEICKKELLLRLGKNIRELRIQQGVSQEELAFKIDSARNFIGCIERAEKSPTIFTLFRIARALNVKLEILVKGIDNFPH